MSAALQELDRTILLCRDHVANELGDVEICERFQSLRVRCVSNLRNVSSHSGQTALITLVSLLSRMGMQVELEIPEIQMISPQPPLSGSSLRAALIASSAALVTRATVNPNGDFDPDLIFVLGDTAIENRGVPCSRLTGDAWSARLVGNETEKGHPWSVEWPIGSMVAAAFAATEAFKFVMRQLRLRNEADQVYFEPLRSCGWDFGPVPVPHTELNLGDVDIISAGAISQAALFALMRLPKARMNGRIFDDDLTGESNLNRNLLTLKCDVGRAKVQVVAQRCNSKFMLEPFATRYRGMDSKSGKLASRILVGVDDIPSRWEVQRHAPGWLAVSGTSHYNISSSAHHPGEACSGCLHPVDDPGLNPIPTVSFVSFWAGLAMAVRLLRDVLFRPYSANNQQLWLTPLRMDLPHAAIWSPVPPVRNCPVGCSASRPLLAA